MVIEQLQSEKGFTVSEKQIARYLLDDNHHIEMITSAELGKLTYTSQSAVTRLYKKLGIQSYREFIYLLNDEKKNIQRINRLIEGNPVHYFNSFEKISETLIKLYEQTIVNTDFLIDKNMMIRICNRLMSARSIDVYGIGITDTVTKQMVFKLQSLGFSCQYHNGYNKVYIQKMKNTQSNVSLLFSMTGVNDTIVSIGKILNEKNIYTAAIVGHRDSELLKYCKDYLYFDMSGYEDVEVMCQIIAVSYICDFIYSVLLSRIKKSSQCDD